MHKVLLLDVAQMLDACCYSPVVIHVVLTTYLPLPYSGETEHCPSH
jgi:hypothetical protein